MSKSNWRGKNGPLLIAEIGGNHEGDFHYAKKLVNLALNTESWWEINVKFIDSSWNRKVGVPPSIVRC